MSSQGYCTTASIPEPLAHSGGGTSALRVVVASPITVVWADSMTDTIAAATACVSVYDGASTSVDGSAFVWLVVLAHGSAHPWLVKESDYATIGTLLDARGAGEWAIHSRIDGDQCYRVAQI